MTWDDAFASLPLIAILRGLTPDESVAVGEALYAAGFRLMEVPLNSPEPLESIRRMRAAFDRRALVGAGTILTPEALQEVVEAGGQLAISPDCRPEVIRAAKAAGLTSVPGFFTPTEAFEALRAGADAIKLFPAEVGGPAHLKAVKAVLPPDAKVLPVGGVSPDTMGAFVKAGAAGFGIGSALYSPGVSAEEVRVRADRFAQAWRSL